LTDDDFGFLLQSGINDWGGISPVTLDFINPERAWPAVPKLREVTARAGFELRERLAVYPEFAHRAPKAVRARVLELADDAGLVRAEEQRW